MFPHMDLVTVKEATLLEYSQIKFKIRSFLDFQGVFWYDKLF